MVRYSFVIIDLVANQTLDIEYGNSYLQHLANGFHDDGDGIHNLHNLPKHTKLRSKI